VCVSVCVFCWLVQTNLCEGCSSISRLKFGEQQYDVNMEGSFVYMPRSLDLGCGILLFWCVELEVLSGQRHILMIFRWRKILIAID